MKREQLKRKKKNKKYRKITENVSRNEAMPSIFLCTFLDFNL